jgi:predicted PurR-regulated permease PerM
MRNPTESDAHPISLALLAAVGVIAALYLGREFFQPIAIAVLLAVSLRPVVRVMARAKVPTALAAGVIVLALMAGLFVAGYALAGPVQKWIRSAPESLSAAESKLARLRRPVQRVNDVAKKIETAAAGPTSQPTPVAPAPPELADHVFGTTTKLVAGLAEVLLLLYLLLAAGDLFMQKVVKVLPLRRDKEQAKQVADDVETAVMRYLLATALINLGQGALVALVMAWLGMPHALLWGVLTFVAEFVPYLGAAGMMAALAVSALASFDPLGRILAPPLAYLIITTIQNNLVSPYAYGQRLKLNPVAVLIGVIFWWFVWGIPGAFVAVPILAATKILADNAESLKPVGEFLGA